MIGIYILLFLLLIVRIFCMFVNLAVLGVMAEVKNGIREEA